VEVERRAGVGGVGVEVRMRVGVRVGVREEVGVEV
jgi:hypothetical protein